MVDNNIVVRLLRLALGSRPVWHLSFWHRFHLDLTLVLSIALIKQLRLCVLASANHPTNFTLAILVKEAYCNLSNGSNIWKRLDNIGMQRFSPAKRLIFSRKPEFIQTVRRSLNWIMSGAFEFSNVLNISKGLNSSKILKQPEKLFSCVSKVQNVWNFLDYLNFLKLISSIRIGRYCSAF